jgi:hypothetical protein
MLNLRVQPAGLTEFAATCTRQADALRTALAPSTSGPGFQASAQAVTASDSMVGAASKTMAERIDDLSSKLSSAAAQYLSHDRLPENPL